MKLKIFTAALVAAALISTAAQAAENTTYICAYYNGAGALINVKNFAEDELENVFGAFAPDDAVKAKLYRWDSELQSEGGLAVTDYPLEVKKLGSITTAPNVTAEMCAASFWQAKDNCSDEVIMTEAEIAELNRKILKADGTHMNDLTAFDGTYDGVSLAKSLADFKPSKVLYLGDKPVPESYYGAIRKNIQNASVTKKMPYKFGFAVNRTIMKDYPCGDYLSEFPSDPEWDALISANRDVNVGYLPYTSANVLTQAFKSLGDRYGWGGMMNAQDCSAFAQEVYRCFGFELARNTSWQAAMPADVTDLTGMTEDEKKAVLDTLPAGAILIMTGHEVIYLGEENGLYYVINDSGSFVPPDDPNTTLNPRSIIINDLSALRANGKTWLESLNYAVCVR